MIIRWILKKQDVTIQTGFIWLYNRFQVWALMKAVMNLWVLTTEDLLLVSLMEMLSDVSVF
jgi:hypothetical protein